MTKPLYYYRQSWGKGTNLQLHSLRQAWRLFNDLQSKKDSLREGRIRERCVVIIDLLGLSLSQLLGMNYISPSAKIPPPRELLKSFLDRIDVENEKKKEIAKKFSDFIDFYDDCRHFGSSKNDKIEELSFSLTIDFFSLAIEIWDIVCNHAKSKQKGTIEFDTVKSILDFDEDKEDEDKW